jgi:aminopeptidase N
LFGTENRFAPLFFQRLAEQRVNLLDRKLIIGEQSFATSNLSFALTAPHPKDDDNAIGLLSVGPIPAAAGFARKLPHYGKYSYSVFQGDEPSIILKGQWQVSASALSIKLTEHEAPPISQIPPHTPLADLPEL